MDDTTPTQDRPKLRARHEPAYEYVHRKIDTPMMLLAFVLAGVLIAQNMLDLSAGSNRTLDIVSWFIWAAFVAEFMLLFWLAASKPKMVRDHLLDLVLIIVPFLRPLRLLRLLRAFTGIGAASTMLRRIMRRRGLDVMGVTVIGILGASALLVTLFERNETNAQITSFGDGLWWAIVTCTTVGYGDLSPISPAGRAIAVVLMLVGIGLLSVVTANVASVFVERDVNDEHERLLQELASVNAKLDAIIASTGQS